MNSSDACRIHDLSRLSPKPAQPHTSHFLETHGPGISSTLESQLQQPRLPFRSCAQRPLSVSLQGIWSCRVLPNFSVTFWNLDAAFLGSFELCSLTKPAPWWRAAKCRYRSEIGWPHSAKAALTSVQPAWQLNFRKLPWMLVWEHRTHWEACLGYACSFQMNLCVAKLKPSKSRLLISGCPFDWTHAALWVSH